MSCGALLSCLARESCHVFRYLFEGGRKVELLAWLNCSHDRVCTKKIAGYLCLRHPFYPPLIAQLGGLLPAQKEKLIENFLSRNFFSSGSGDIAKNSVYMYVCMWCCLCFE